MWYTVGHTNGVLHHYKLTRFSNVPPDIIRKYKFCTITNLQGSQTHDGINEVTIGFAPLQTYKVLKQAYNPLE